MEPITLALLLLAGAGAAAALSWSAVRSWLSGTGAVQADLIRQALSDGKINVVAVGLSSSGSEIGRKSWRTGSLDSDLATAFGRANRIRVNV